MTVLLPGLHAISLFTTLSTRRTFANALGMNGGVVSPMVHDIELPHEMRRGSAFHSTTQVRAEDDAGKSMSQTSSVGGGAGRGGRRPPVPLVVKVEQERQITYDVRSDSDEDFLARESRGRRTIDGSPRDCSSAFAF